MHIHWWIYNHMDLWHSFSHRRPMVSRAWDHLPLTWPPLDTWFQCLWSPSSIRGLFWPWPNCFAMVSCLTGTDTVWCIWCQVCVLFHNSPGWISLAFGKDPLYSDGDFFLYMQHCLLWTMAIITSILITTPPIHLLLLANICFCPSWATWKPHHQLIHNTIIYHICASKGAPVLSCGSYHSWDKVWNAVESKTKEILLETRCHSETIGVPLVETVFKTWFSLVKCSLLSWPLHSYLKKAMLISWKGYQDHHQL